MINNYKVLQNVFNKLNISKVRLGASLQTGSVSHFHCLSTVFPLQSIDVNKLIKGKPLDNMEFIQWLKSHFDKVTAGQGVPDYNGPGRRSQTKGGPAASRGASSAPTRPANTKYESLDALDSVYRMFLHRQEGKTPPQCRAPHIFTPFFFLLSDLLDSNLVLCT